jgi:transposase
MFIHFKNNGQKERYLRIVQLVMHVEAETHQAFVKNLLSTHRAEANEKALDGDLTEEEQAQKKKEWEATRMMFFTEEL